MNFIERRIIYHILFNDIVEKNQLRLILAFGVFGVTSSSFIFLAANKEPYSIAFVRVFLTGSISYFIFYQFNKPSEPIKIENLDRKKIFLSGFCLATHFGWWFASLNYIQVGISLAMTNTAPVWLTLILFLIYARKPKPKQRVAIILVLLGTVLLLIQDHEIEENGTIGLALALGSAIGFAIYLAIAHNLVEKYGLWRYFGLVNLSSAVCLFIFTLIRDHLSDLMDIEIWFWGLLLALIPGISGHAIYNFSMGKLDPIDVGIATLGEPVLGTTIAYFFLDQKLTILESLSIIVLISAIGFTIDKSKNLEMDT